MTSCLVAWAYYLTCAWRTFSAGCCSLKTDRRRDTALPRQRGELYQRRCVAKNSRLVNRTQGRHLKQLNTALARMRRRRIPSSCLRLHSWHLQANFNLRDGFTGSNIPHGILPPPYRCAWHTIHHMGQHAVRHGQGRQILRLSLPPTAGLYALAHAPHPTPHAHPCPTRTPPPPTAPPPAPCPYPPLPLPCDSTMCHVNTPLPCLTTATHTHTFAHFAFCAAVARSVSVRYLTAPALHRAAAGTLGKTISLLFLLCTSYCASRLASPTATMNHAPSHNSNKHNVASITLPLPPWLHCLCSLCTMT